MTRLIAAIMMMSFGMVSNGFAMELASPDIASGAPLAKAQVYPECGGGNISPALSWKGAPAATKSFAVTMFDPDATGGWWHWIVYDIPANVHALGGGAGDAPLPAGMRVGRNDFGVMGYGGACPPPGSGVHHYRFTVWALGTATTPFNGTVKGATIGPYLANNALASATLMATYER